MTNKMKKIEKDYDLMRDKVDVLLDISNLLAIYTHLIIFLL